MKTAEEKARAVIMAIKEQDRDTRHACAVALLGLERYGLSAQLIKIDEARSACVNCIAV